MTERGIIFSAPMVRALLAGTKTQTRRVAKKQPHHETTAVEWNTAEGAFVPWRLGTGTPNSGRRTGEPLRCPYGVVGDRLWVREAWRTWERPSDSVDGVLFRADDAFRPIENTRDAAERWVDLHANGKHRSRWRSPIHMPRWASRITLEVTEVRAQRLQDISEDDASAEGIKHGELQPAIVNGERSKVAIFDPRTAFAHAWGMINGYESWRANPWVWAVTFKRVEQ